MYIVGQYAYTRNGSRCAQQGVETSIQFKAIQYSVLSIISHDSSVLLWVTKCKFVLNPIQKNAHYQCINMALLHTARLSWCKCIKTFAIQNACTHVYISGQIMMTTYANTKWVEMQLSGKHIRRGFLIKRHYALAFIELIKHQCRRKYITFKCRICLIVLQFTCFHPIHSSSRLN